MNESCDNVKYTHVRVKYLLTNIWYNEYPHNEWWEAQAFRYSEGFTVEQKNRLRRLMVGNLYAQRFWSWFIGKSDAKWMYYRIPKIPNPGFQWQGGWRKPWSRNDEIGVGWIQKTSAWFSTFYPATEKEGKRKKQKNFVVVMVIPRFSRIVALTALLFAASKTQLVSMKGSRWPNPEARLR